MHKLVTGFAAAVVLALSALTLTPQNASAQGFSITFGTGQPPMVRYFDDRERLAPRHRYDHRHYERHDDRRHYERRHDRRSYRHAPRQRHARDCTVRIERYWDGYSWVSERRRICR